MIMPTDENPIIIINNDCLKVMKEIPDNSIDLVLTDPPYGINCDRGIGDFGAYKSRKYEDNWDNETPSKEYFDEILRIGKKVIIFGGNYFIDKLPFKKSWIIWDKIGNQRQFNFLSDVELAWTNLDRNISKKYFILQKGFMAEERERFHPTQKPVKLFRNIIKDYTKEGDTILDCFGGSGTTAIACKQIKRKCIFIEMNKKYCDMTKKRLEQQTLWEYLKYWNNLKDRYKDN